MALPCKFLETNRSDSIQPLKPNASSQTRKDAYKPGDGASTLRKPVPEILDPQKHVLQISWLNPGMVVQSK